MIKNKLKKSLTALWCLTFALLFCIGGLNFALPSEVVLTDGEEMAAYPCISYTNASDEIADGFGTVTNVKAKLFGVVTVKEIKLKNYEGLKLIPGGTTLGMKLPGDGVSVVGMADVASQGQKRCPALEAGLKEKDVIVSVDGNAVKTVTALMEAIAASNGKPLTLLCKRGAKEMTVTLTPVKSDSDGKYKGGMWVKDISAGIGTVTYIHPETGEFGALGHGICDKETGALTASARGVITDCVVTGIVKGQKGTPGELRGYLKSDKRGALLKNTECGVFGVLTEYKGEAIPIASAKEVTEGKAVLRSALDGSTPVDYEIEISHIKNDATKSFIVTVTDQRLLEKTGGIVQGMSGSPIIQNGKLIGAVTHVMVANPTAGYGIFIENMLNAAEMPQARAS